METETKTSNFAVCSQCGRPGLLRLAFDENVCESCEVEIGKMMDESEIRNIIVRQSEEFVLKVVEQYKQDNTPF